MSHGARSALSDQDQHRSNTTRLPPAVEAPLRWVRPGRPARRPARVGGDARGSVRDPGRQVVELDGGITVYPSEAECEPWRAVFTENGQRRYRQAATEAKLVAKLERSGNGWRPTRRMWSGPVTGGG